MNRVGPRRAAATAYVCALSGALLLAASPAAWGFELKHTASGQPVHWATSNVSFVVDSSLDKAAAGGAACVDGAAHGWSGAAGAPTLATSSGKGATQPAIDGKNTVLFAPNGFAPAGAALAVTVVSYDASSGEIVDADIVVNGKHSFAVLASGATAPSGSTPVSTEGTGDEGDDGPAVFDLPHVVAHEFGHALGLADAFDTQTALMYPYTLPDDASARAPQSDDLDGMDALYGEASSNSAPASASCTANVAGGRVRAHDALVGTFFAVASLTWLASRRRARAFVPVSAAALVFLVGSGEARSASSAAGAGSHTGGADARGLVVSTTTRNVGGVFQTDVEIEPHSCAHAATCPQRATAHVWGGAIGGIVQEVGGRAAPQVDDEVEVAFTGIVTEVSTEAAVLAVHAHLSKR